MRLTSASATFLASGVVLAGGLIFTGLLKFSDVHGGNAVQHSLINRALAPWMLIALGVVEVILALGLATPLWRRASQAAFAMLTIYALVFSWIVATGQSTAKCGCFGSWDAPIGAHYAMLFGLLLVSRTLAFSAIGVRE